MKLKDATKERSGQIREGKEAHDTHPGRVFSGLSILPRQAELHPEIPRSTRGLAMKEFAVIFFLAAIRFLIVETTTTLKISTYIPSLFCQHGWLIFNLIQWSISTPLDLTLLRHR